MTDEELEALAKTMVRPIRCGGLDYIGPDRTPVYKVGGKEYTFEEFEALKKSLNPQ